MDRLRLVGLAAGGLLAVCGIAWAVGGVLTAGQVPAGTTVSGVAIGGLDEAEAVARLEEELGPRADGDLTLSVGGMGDVPGEELTLAPGEAGLEGDYA
ncbi:MAG TPA: hypothetical protein PK324_19360, partial [Nocardioides sp.]|nr:hypothetical protein [Nocardioides sp.]